MQLEELWVGHGLDKLIYFGTPPATTLSHCACSSLGCLADPQWSPHAEASCWSQRQFYVLGFHQNSFAGRVVRKECQPLGGGGFEVLLEMGMERMVQEEGARMGKCSKQE